MLHQNGFYTYHGLYQCSHIRNTISTHITHNRPTEDVNSHRRKHCHPHCTYQFHQIIPYIFIDTYTTHVLIPNKQFLLLIDMPIQDRSHQITIYEIFTLDILHGNFTAHYDIATKYLGITRDETMAVELSSHQFQICQAANGQFCTISTPFQHLANPPTCTSALYTRKFSKHYF